MAPHIYIDALHCSEIDCMAFGPAVMSSIKNPLTLIAVYLVLWLGGHLLWSVLGLEALGGRCNIITTCEKLSCTTLPQIRIQTALL